jgi:RNA polymerase sigma factor (sigma-70 family)
LGPDEEVARFERAILPHLDAAYNVARWLTRNDHDAEDVVQEAYLRAFRFFGGFHGVDGRAWLLTIVRNTANTWLTKNRPPEPTVAFDEEKYSRSPVRSPEAALVQAEDTELLHRAIEELPREFREVIVLRELEGLSYKEIAGITAVPLGTVMSRLARARERLEQRLARHKNEEPKREL